MNVELEICTDDGFGFGHKEWLKKSSNTESIYILPPSLQGRLIREAPPFFWQNKK